MKRLLLSVVTVLVSLVTVSAQTDNTATTAPSPAVRFGYLSCDSAMRAMPEYTVARKNIDDLKAQYDAEMKRVEDEFNQKYETFLENQRSLAPSILQKRQAELQEMMEKNMAFKAEARRLLEKAEDEALAPVRAKVSNAIRQVGQARSLAFVINTDGNAMPYADAVMGEDITDAVIRVAK